MRIPTYLSYSAIDQWRKNREEFFFKYLASKRPERSPQERPASVGSAFDAVAKSMISRHLFGRGAKPQFEFESIFEKQVEAHNRDFAREAGFHAFDAYRSAGAFAELLGELERADGEPQMEFSANGTIGDVPLTGKPDLRYRTAEKVEIVHDFKVQGYCAKNSGQSPTKGYSFCNDGWADWEAKPTRGGAKAHVDFKPFDFNGMVVGEGFLEGLRYDWPQQLSIYAWLTGLAPGDETFVATIHQLVCKPGKRPLVRVARFANRVSHAFQIAYLDEIKGIWKRINAGEIFDGMDHVTQEKHCKELDRIAARLVASGDEEDAFFNSVTRAGGYRG